MFKQKGVFVKVGDLVKVVGYPEGFSLEDNIGLVTAIIPAHRGNLVQFLMLGMYHIMRESHLEVINESENKKA